MKTMIVCDMCAKQVPSGTGALVLVYGGACKADSDYHGGYME